MRRILLLVGGLVLVAGLTFGGMQLFGADSAEAVSSGVVFEDVDGDGEQGDGEPGLSDVEVLIESEADPDRPTVVRTDQDGAWEVGGGGGGGALLVSVVPDTLPGRPGLVPVLTTEPGTYAFVPEPGDERRDLDFGYEYVEPPEPSLSGSSGDAAPDPVESSDEPTEPAAPAPTGCDLVGTWDLREQPFLDQISAMAAGEVPVGGFDAEHVSGNYLVTLDASGAYTGRRNDWTFRFSTAQGAIVVSIDAEDSGTWSADGGTISISEPAGQAEVTFFVEQGGQRVPMPIAPPQSVGTDAISGSGPYECRGDVLLTTFQGVTSTFDRRG